MAIEVTPHDTWTNREPKVITRLLFLHDDTTCEGRDIWEESPAFAMGLQVFGLLRQKVAEVFEGPEKRATGFQQLQFPMKCDHSINLVLYVSLHIVAHQAASRAPATPRPAVAVAVKSKTCINKSM